MSALATPPRTAPDPRVRLAVALAALALVLVAPHPATSLALAGVSAAALVAGRGLRWRAFAPAAFIGLPAAMLAAWLTPGPPAWRVALGRVELELSRAGLDRATLLLARVLASGLVVAWLSSGLRVSEVAKGLRAFRVPAPLLDLLVLADRHRHALRESFETVRAAQTLRLGYGSARRSVASASTLMGTIACRALDQAATTTEAMQLRGDRASHVLPPLRLERGDARLLLGAATALAAGAVLSWRLRWP